jgi:hypothetical protein
VRRGKKLLKIWFTFEVRDATDYVIIAVLPVEATTTGRRPRKLTLEECFWKAIEVLNARDERRYLRLAWTTVDWRWYGRKQKKQEHVIPHPIDLSTGRFTPKGMPTWL